MRILIIILLLFTLPSCGMFKKWKEKHELKVKNDIVQTVGTTTVEKVDTLIPIRATNVKVTRPLTELLEGKPIVASNGSNKVEISYDKDTKIVTAVGTTEAHNVPVVIDRTIREDVKTVDKTSVKKDYVVVKTERKTSSGFAWGFLVAIVVLFCFIILFVWFNRKF